MAKDKTLKVDIDETMTAMIKSINDDITTDMREQIQALRSELIPLINGLNDNLRKLNFIPKDIEKIKKRLDDIEDKLD